MHITQRNLCSNYKLNMTKELMRFHCGCHGNKVTIGMRYEAEPIVPLNLPTKHGLNMTQDKRVIDVSLWLPWSPSYHSNEVCASCL